VGTDGSKTWQGKLNYLSPNFSLSTGTMRLRAELDNPDGVLKPGLYVSVTLPYATAEKAILVDNASIGTDQLGKYLYVVNDSNVVNVRHIEVGQLVDDNRRIVTSGLSPDERYVTKALMKVRQGMKIQPIEK
jgi:RND family efflux transporter MFP subunit